MFIEIPAVDGTPESRIAALREARELLKEEPKTSAPAIFGGTTTDPGAVAGPSALIRLATYIETGHDYADTHPKGKRRPLVKNTHVTLVAPTGIPTPDDIEHLLSHVSDGSFGEFVEAMLKEQAEKAEEGEKADEKPPFDL